MKYAEINNLQPQELKKRLDQTRQALFNARMKHKMQRLSNMMELRNFRRDIARLETALSVLPESAFVSDKKLVKDTEALEKKAVKSLSGKAQFKKQDKSKKLVEEKAVGEGSKVKANEEKQDQKKESRKKVTLKQQESKKPSKDKPSSKIAPRKKWFGFFGSKQKSSKAQQSGGRRSFFRRKSG